MTVTAPEFLLEAYYGKSPDLVECESLIAQIRKNYSSGESVDLTRKNCPELDRIAVLLEKKFNFDELEMRILRPKPATYILSSFLPSTELSLSTTLLFSIVPNAYTFGAGNVSPLTPIRTVETADSIRYETAQSGLVHVTGPLFFSPTATPAQIMAIIMHEIGHNFFLKTSVRLARAVNQVISTLMELVLTYDSWESSMGALKRSATRGGQMTFGLGAGLLTRILATFAHLFPRFSVFMHTASAKVFDVVETGLRALLPRGFTKFVEETLGSPRLTAAGTAMSQIIIIMGMYISLLMQAATKTGYFVFTSLNKTFFTIREIYNTLAPFFLGYREDEIYADAFATRHGYGKEVAQFAEIFSKLQGGSLKARSLGIFAGVVRFVMMIMAVRDPHPANIVRAKLAGDALRKELDDTEIRGKLREQVLKQIEYIEKVHDRMVASDLGTVNGQLYRFHVALTDYAEGKIGAGELSSITWKTLKGDATLKEDVDGADFRPLHELIESAAATHGVMETDLVLTEGLGSLIKNLATEDVEDQIEELRGEARDIHTPEQQRYVLTKIIRLLERLIILRHNPGAVQKFVHDTAAFFQRMLGDKDAGKEMTLRIGEAIRDLAKLRDEVLRKQWKDEKWDAEVQKMKDRAAELVDSASKQTVNSDDF
jgi:Zn-dependent protease with chaperone function